jgi:hypothetical protein
MDKQNKEIINNIQKNNFSQPTSNVDFHPYPQIIQPYMYGRQPQCVIWLHFNIFI